MLRKSRDICGCGGQNGCKKDARPSKPGSDAAMAGRREYSGEVSTVSLVSSGEEEEEEEEENAPPNIATESTPKQRDYAQKPTFSQRKVLWSLAESEDSEVSTTSSMGYSEDERHARNII